MNNHYEEVLKNDLENITIFQKKSERKWRWQMWLQPTCRIFFGTTKKKLYGDASAD